MKHFDNAKRDDGAEKQAAITTENYLSDFEGLHEEFVGQLKNLNNIKDSVQAAAGLSFNPDDYLDKVLPASLTQKAVKLDFEFRGVNSAESRRRYGESPGEFISAGNIRSLAERMQQKFSGNATLQKDLNWFLSVWPKAEEVTGMGTDTIYNNANEGGGYYVNEYGRLMTGQQTSDNAKYSADTTKSNSNSTWQVTDGTYNNRNYGYRYPTYRHNKTKIRLTTGGREYILQDSIFTSPIVLDMDGDGKLEASNGEWMPHPYTDAKLAEFDMNGDYFTDLTEWVGPNDGLLIVYNGGEVNARNLFGEGSGFLHGFEKLALLDSNVDNNLTGEELTTISVWQDKNGNAKVEAGEVTPVTKLGITSIDVTHKQFVSSFVQNGTTKTSWDWYPVVFRVKKQK